MGARRSSASLVLVSLLGSMGLLSCRDLPAPRPPGKCVMDGTVTTVDGVPIARVKVRILSPSMFGRPTPKKVEQRTLGVTVTDVHGRFRCTRLPTKGFDVKLTKDGYRSWVSPPFSPLAPDGTPTKETFCMDGGMSASGVVEDNRHKPLRGVLVWPDDNEDVWWETTIGGGADDGTTVHLQPVTESGRDGSFVLTGLTPGLHTINFGKHGYATRSEARVAAGTTEMTISLEPGRKIHGVVRGPDGSPIPNIRVTAVPTDPLPPHPLPSRLIARGMPLRMGNRWGVTNLKGRFTIVGLRNEAYDLVADELPQFETPGTRVFGPLMEWPQPGPTVGLHYLEAYCTGLPHVAIRHHVLAGTWNVRLVLPRSHTISGTVVDTAGVPVAGAAVSITFPAWEGPDWCSSASPPVTKPIPKMYARYIITPAVTTNKTGDFKYGGLPPSTYKISAGVFQVSSGQITIKVDHDVRNARIVVKKEPDSPGK